MNSTPSGRSGGTGPIVPPLRLKPRSRTRIADIAVAIILPWLVFFLVVSLFLFAWRDMKGLVWGILGTCMFLALFFLVMGCMRRSGTILALGYLCVIAIFAGFAVGFWIDAEYLQRYWELDTGTEYKEINPTLGGRNTTPGASVIHFVNGTFVDDRRTMGYVTDGSIFCVAPVALQPYYDAKVSYWAVGEDCCQMRSNFDCGTAREVGATTVVIEKPKEAYFKAIEQAVSVYGLSLGKNVTANSTKLVSFVSDPQATIDDIWDEALTVALVAMIIALSTCALVGFMLSKIISSAPPGPQQHPLIPQKD